VKRSTWFVLVIVAFAGATVATDEQQSHPRPIGGLAFVDEFELTIVNVIASVTDKDGKPVTNLSRDDFRLFQDGNIQPITNFQLYTKEVYERRSVPDSALPPLEPPDAATEAPTEPILEPQPVNVVIYVDNENLHPLDRNRVLAEARGFVIDNLRPPVRMMVVSEHKGLEILQPFTSDPGPVLEALRSIRLVAGGRTGRDSDRQDIVDRMMREVERMGSVSGFVTLPHGAALSSPTFGEIRSFAEEESNRLSFTIDRLREVVSFLAGLPGRKSIVYLSNGLPTVPGFDLFRAFSDTFRDPTILTETQRFDRSSSLNSLIDAANSVDATFHTIGAGGLEIPGMTRSSRGARDPVLTSPSSDDELSGLRLIAAGTGGLSIVKTNDFEEGFARIEQDIFTYYSLGYRHLPTGKDRMHRIEVTLPGHPGLEIRNRRRFVEKSLETRAQERVLANLLHEIDDNPMDLELLIGSATMASEDLWSLQLFVSVPMSKIALLPNGEDYVGTVALFAAARKFEGESSRSVRREYELRIPASVYQEAPATRLSVHTELLVTEGSHRVAVGLVDLLSRQASFEKDVITLAPRSTD
jgi:VWFA-related protein